MKLFDVCGIGNAIVDILVRVSDEAFATLGMEKQTMRLVTVDEQTALLEKLDQTSFTLAAGGSVANSVIAVAQLGGTASFLGCLGDDRYGVFYKNEFDTLGIKLGLPLSNGGVTGTSLVIITPDSERTMRTNLGSAAELSAEHVAEEPIAASRWLFIEGYLLTNTGAGFEAVRQAIAFAKKNDCQIALTLSEPWVVEGHREQVDEVLAASDLVFANEFEAQALTGESSWEGAFRALKSQYPAVCVTAGEKGALAAYDGEEASSAAFTCNLQDLTGAGDMFAGSFLYGVTHEVPLSQVVRGACYMSMKVVSQTGARLPAGAPAYWQECFVEEGKLG